MKPNTKKKLLTFCQLLKKNGEITSNDFDKFAYLLDDKKNAQAKPEIKIGDKETIAIMTQIINANVLWGDVILEWVNDNAEWLFKEYKKKHKTKKIKDATPHYDDEKPAYDACNAEIL